VIVKSQTDLTCSDDEDEDDSDLFVNPNRIAVADSSSGDESSDGSEESDEEADD